MAININIHLTPTLLTSLAVIGTWFICSVARTAYIKHKYMNYSKTYRAGLCLDEYRGTVGLLSFKYSKSDYEVPKGYICMNTVSRIGIM